MPILTERQRRLIEVGRIRVGDPKPSEKQPGRPRSTFRLTSRHKELLEVAAQAYGGTVTQVDGGYQLCCEKATIKALLSLKPLPNGDMESLSQNYEQWKGGTCTRRCNGETVQVWEKSASGKHDRVARPCQCDPLSRECKLVTRVSVILSEVPALGLWRLDTQSKVFDAEISGLLAAVESLGIPSPVPVTLTITTREGRKGPGEVNSKYPVVSVALDAKPVPFTAMVEGIRRTALALPGSLGDVPVLEPGPSALPEPIEHEVLDAEPVEEIDPQDWVANLIGEDSARDWKAAFQGANKDWATFCARAMARNVSVAQLSQGAGEVLKGG